MKLEISENIKKLRKEHYLTQEQLAEALGVTVGAVHKWETGQSMPEIRLLVELAELFEISVDTILGYTWQADNVNKTVEKIYDYINAKDFENGERYVEKSLKKYPNSFEIVYHSAEFYMLSAPFERKKAWRAIELYRNAIRLVKQNKQNHISAETIEDRIALCYSNLGRNDEAIDILKKNNAEGRNEFRIGYILSNIDGRQNEALEHLSDALGFCWSHLFNICAGYANAYIGNGEYKKLKMLLNWLYTTGQGLRDTSKVNYLDRGDITVFSALALVSLLENERESAKKYLIKAKKLAERFDSSPNYDFTEIYFCHSSEAKTAYDDMGDTAIDIIVNFINKDSTNKKLLPIWKEILNEA